MELSWGVMLPLLVLCAGAWLWYETLGAREQANATAIEACRSTGAHLLDGTVAFRSIRPVRGAGGALQIERSYVFDYSVDGVTRQQGVVVLTGRRVNSVVL